jgi:hypothetical protein
MRSGEDSAIVHPRYSLLSSEYVGSLSGSFSTGHSTRCRMTNFGVRKESGMRRNRTGRVAILVSHGEILFCGQ